MVLLCDYVVNCGEPADVDWPTLISSIGAVAVGIIALFVSKYQINKTLNSQKEIEKRAEIYKKLNDFYGPLLQLRMKSSLLYKKFEEKYRAADPNFSTLTYLLDNKTFHGNDSVLLDEIIKIGEQCEKLIHDKAGLIDDTNLRLNVIPKATTHFLVLRLAHKKALIGEVQKFKDLVFPKDLDQLLEKRKKELETELNLLNNPT